MRLARSIASRLAPQRQQQIHGTFGRYFHASAVISSSTSNQQGKSWADPAQRQYKFWNRETSDKGTYSYLLDISPESIQREAKIISLADPNEPADELLHNGKLPLSSSLLGIGTSLQDFEHLMQDPQQQPNVAFMCPSCPRAASQLPLVLAAFPSIEWVHCRSAGIDFVESEELQELCNRSRNVTLTNAKGQFSSSLAEYVMMACSYFAKDLPRLMRQQANKNWEKYDVEELRGKTMGIVGYGDIGKACAKLASVYGMRIVALRRHPFLSKNDPLCDVVYGTDKASLNQLMSESDYIVCSAPSTVETRGMVNAQAFEAVKENAVFINLGRGPVVDEAALITALKSGKLKGAALDVFTEEPIPQSSEMWDLDNLLISPHNMDQTATFMHEATQFFLNENLPRFLCGEDLLNPVDPVLGY
ncbi:Glyoxylate/hydroxypyruvate reductase [Seminavis robusta]|uniref:Glyoxylate/hydroxypyruvate reductase n=1 Tax=Seminavis robusta TaxID=568900 RepID=A0A9N8HNN5_9STRA|nr:Glyoxylate/hydroxypyruvate reductase [Seminavis robusta]|eukprot:Sro1011_g231090.1 Glyoxylate/hydroxypyruvate reductase (418) ;mRNA; r:27940-29434